MSTPEEIIAFISKLPFVKTVVTAQTIIYCIGCPIMVIYFLYPAVYEKEDILKLLLISISIGTVVYSVLFSLHMLIYALKSLFERPLSTDKILEKSGLMSNVLITLVIIFEAFNYSLFSLSTIKYNLVVVILSIMIAITFYEFGGTLFKYICKKIIKRKKIQDTKHLAK